MNDSPEKLFTIACLGDSITYGHGVSDTRTRDAWPYVLQRLLGSAFKVLEYGRNGATAIEGVPDSYRAGGLLEKALSSGADVFILMLGTNDTKARYWDEEAYRKGLRDLALRLLETGPSRLFLMLPPKAFPLEDGTFAYGVDDALIRERVIPAIEELAADLGLPVIDLYALTEGRPELFLEGVHPNIEGNAAIAERVFRSLISACGDLPDLPEGRSGLI